VQPICTHIHVLIIASHNYLSVFIIFRNSFFTLSTASRDATKIRVGSNIIVIFVHNHVMA